MFFYNLIQRFNGYLSNLYINKPLLALWNQPSQRGNPLETSDFNV